MQCPACLTDNPAAQKFCGNCGAPLRARAAAAELRQLTVLFCDVVGSTQLSEALDPEDLREVLAGYHAACEAAIRAHDGHIAQYLGDGVLAYFGYPHAHEDAAHRGVRAGLGIVAAISAGNARLARGPGIALAVRVGIHTGPVVVGEVGGGERRENLALGKTPNVAARLQGAAEPGTVLVSGDTYRIVRGFFEFADLGEQQVKGLSEAVQAYRADRESGAESRLEVARRAGLTPLAGRVHEQEALEAHWNAVATDGGHAVLVQGEPGIGKSRLVDMIQARAKRDGAAVFESQCTPYARGTTLFPVVGLLERSLGFRRDTPEADRRALLEQRLARREVLTDESRALMSALLGVPLVGDDPTAGYPPHRRRERTLATLREWLFATARGKPVLWVVEDLHWADPTTLDFITEVLRTFTETPALVVLTSRSEFDPPWAPSGRVTRLALARLAADDTRSIARHVARGKALPDELLAQLVTRAEGVPLFVEEVTKAILELGLLVERHDRFDLAGPLPPELIPSTLQDSLNARLDRLGPAKATAQIAATLGREFRLDLLTEVAGSEPAALHEHIDRLVRAELVYPNDEAAEPTYFFKHALIQEAAYNSLLRKARRDLHRKVAETLLSRFPGDAAARPELVAEHFTAAGEPESAVPQWTLAGERANARAAYEEAVAHLRRALALVQELPDDARDARELQIQFGLIPALISTRGWSTPELAVVYDRARALLDRGGPSPAQFLVASGTLGYNLTGGRLSRALELCHEVLGLAEQLQVPMFLAMAHQNYSATWLYCADADACVRHAEAGLKLFDPAIEQAITQMVGLSSFVAYHCYANTAHWLLGDPVRGLAASDAAMAAAERHGHPHSLACALAYRLQLLHFGGEHEAAIALADRAEAQARDEALLFWVAPAQLYRGASRLALGQAERAAGEIRDAMANFVSGGGGICGALFRSFVAEGLWATGDRAGAHRAIEDGLAHVAANGEHLWESELHRLRAEFLAVEAADRRMPEVTILERAAAAAETAVTLARAQRAVPLEVRALATLARTQRALGRPDDAARAALRAICGRYPDDVPLLPELRAARALLATA